MWEKKKNKKTLMWPTTPNELQPMATKTWQKMQNFHNKNKPAILPEDHCNKSALKFCKHSVSNNNADLLSSVIYIQNNGCDCQNTASEEFQSIYTQMQSLSSDP